MAIIEGFERYEALAYFGFHQNADGVEAIVNVTEQTIEICDLHEKVLAIWAPYSYRCNELEIPVRCYFSGEEWLAPKDEELANILNRFLENKNIPPRQTSTQPKVLHRTLITAAIFIALSTIGYFTFKNAFSNLIDDNIARQIENQIEQNEIQFLRACDFDTEPLLRDLILSNTQGQDYVFVKGLDAAFVRLPTGRLAIDNAWAQNLKNEEELIALLNLARIENEMVEPTEALLKGLGLRDQINFLRTARLPDEKLKEAFELYQHTQQIDFDKFSLIEAPVGNFGALKATVEIYAPSGETLPYIPSQLELGNRDWQTLLNTCP